MSDDRVPLALAEPDTTWRISEEDRARLLPAFDPEALERLLQLSHPERRAWLLSRFQVPEDGSWPKLLIHVGHPAMDEILEEVWATYWADAPIEALTSEVDAQFPGRRLALARRRAEQERG